MDLIELKKVNEVNFRRHPWEITRLSVLLHFVRKLIPKPSLMVDMGSGDGFMAKNLALNFPQAKIMAIDINYSENTINQLKAGSPRNIAYLQSPSSLFKNGDPKIDLVVLMDVMEHIEDPGSFLHELMAHEQISPSTIFFITVPAFQWLFSSHDRTLGHFKRYNRTELIEKMKTHGMNIRYSGYFFTSLLLVRVLQKLQPEKNPKDQLYNWKGGKLLTKLLTASFWLEFRISRFLSHCNISLPGLTCYCVCQPLPS